MEGMPELSPGMQTIVTLVGGVIAAAIYHFSKLKKPNADVSKDVVVPNINVMDSMAIKEAAQELRASRTDSEARGRQIRDMQLELIRHSEQLDQIVKLGKERNELIEDLSERLRKVLRNMADGA